MKKKLVIVISLIMLAGIIKTIAYPYPRAMSHAGYMNLPNSGYFPADSHSGTLLQIGKSFYLYGETDSCGFRWQDPATNYCGVHIYSSNDLMHWSQPKAMFNQADPFWVNLCMGQLTRPGWGCWRPKVIYNQNTQKYVAWIQTGADSGDTYIVLTSQYPDHDWQIIGQPDLQDSQILGWNGEQNALDGDQNLFADKTGNGWLVYNRLGRLVLEKLNLEYTSGVGQPITNLPQPRDAEAPSLFERNGNYYLAMSDPRCAYCSHVQTGIMESSNLDGSWRFLGDIGDLGQPNGVTKIDKDYFISFDQWIEAPDSGTFPQLNETAARQYFTTLNFDNKGIPSLNLR